MAGYQIAHVSTYDMKPRSSQGNWRTIDGILHEAGRVPGSTNHVPGNLEPDLLLGKMPLSLLHEAVGFAAAARNAKDWLRRSDGGALVAGVASWPVPRDQITSGIMPSKGTRIASRFTGRRFACPLRGR